MSALLEVRDLVVDYPVRGGHLRAVDHVSFSVEAGRTLAIVGESGCGKSTIARSIVRLIEPTAGAVVLDGDDVTHLAERKLRRLRERVQMVFQDPYGSLDPRLTAERIVGEALRLRGDTVASARQYLDQVGLPADAAERRPHEFSGGQRQRIGIARALAARPELIVLDEATSALDVSVQAEILRLLANLKDETAVTFVMISHNLGVVREVSDTVLVMSEGRVVESGPTHEVLARPRESYTRTLRAAALDPTTMVGRKPRVVLPRETQ